MSDLDHQLDRLLQAAREAARSGGFSAVAPFGLETRVLAAWREAGADRGAGFWSTGLLWRGLAVASAIMALCLWPALSEKASPDADSLQLADSTLQMDNL